MSENALDPVTLYFRFALGPQPFRIVSARFRQSGVMRASGTAAWRRFTATEMFTTRPVGFRWEASMRMAPLVSVRIRDRYRDGAGASEAKIAGLIGVGKLPPSPEAAAASLVRFLAEAPWLPTVLLPSDAVRWTALGERRARVALADCSVTVSMEVEFGQDGSIVRTSTERYRDDHGKLVLTPWSCEYRSYERVDGMMIPMKAEVSWTFPGTGTAAVWRGRIVSAGYEYAEAI